MLVRMVKMTFREDAIDHFIAFFEARKERIRGFDGCSHLALWQDNLDRRIFFTYSHWNDEASLNHYRNSAFFKDTWQQTKTMFSAKAEAWSLDQLYVLT